MGNIDWQYALEILPQLLRAAVITIEATIVGFFFAVLVGLLLALSRRSSMWLISRPAAFIVEFVRTTPLLAQLFFLFYVLPRYGLRLPAFTIGVIGLGLHYGAYTSEVFRAGIDAITRGQWEASIALNFSRQHTWTRIILPQAIPPMIPALGNYFIAMFKETPLLSAITVVEMFQQAKIISSQTFQPLEPFTLVGVIFFILSYPSAMYIRRLEVRFAKQNG
jgi:polar amino acid transport system permease protein